jgi:hypothetical protein
MREKIENYTPLSYHEYDKVNEKCLVKIVTVFFLIAINIIEINEVAIRRYKLTLFYKEF